jgi:hypothetical protein
VGLRGARARLAASRDHHSVGPVQGKWPMILFPISNPFSNLKKNQQEVIKIVEILRTLEKCEILHGDRFEDFPQLLY